jgi:hypothetical protein
MPRDPPQSFAVGLERLLRPQHAALWLDQQGLDTAGSNGLSLFDVTEMMSPLTKPARQNSTRTGSRSRTVGKVWTPADRQGQGGESRYRTGRWQGCAASGAARGYIGCVSVPSVVRSRQYRGDCLITPSPTVAGPLPAMDRTIGGTNGQNRPPGLSAHRRSRGRCGDRMVGVTSSAPRSNA